MPFSNSKAFRLVIRASKAQYIMPWRSYCPGRSRKRSGSAGAWTVPPGGPALHSACPAILGNGFFFVNIDNFSEPFFYRYFSAFKIGFAAGVRIGSVLVKAANLPRIFPVSAWVNYGEIPVSVRQKNRPFFFRHFLCPVFNRRSFGFNPFYQVFEAAFAFSPALFLFQLRFPLSGRAGSPPGSFCQFFSRVAPTLNIVSRSGLFSSGGNGWYKPNASGKISVISSGSAPSVS